MRITHTFYHVTLRLVLATSGFSLIASYADVRGEPHARGRCHDADYVGVTELPTILVPDVGRAHPVTVPDESTALVRARRTSN